MIKSKTGTSYIYWHPSMPRWMGLGDPGRLRDGRRKGYGTYPAFGDQDRRAREKTLVGRGKRVNRVGLLPLPLPHLSAFSECSVKMWALFGPEKEEIKRRVWNDEFDTLFVFSLLEERGFRGPKYVCVWGILVSVLWTTLSSEPGAEGIYIHTHTCAYTCTNKLVFFFVCGVVNIYYYHYQHAY